MYKIVYIWENNGIIISVVNNYFIEKRRLKMIIKLARVKKNLSLEQLSEKTGISRITLSKYEKDDCGSMTLKTLKKLTNVLELTSEEVWELIQRIEI